MTKNEKTAVILWGVLVLAWSIYVWLCYSELPVMLGYLTGGAERGVLLMAAGMTVLTLAAVYGYFLLYPPEDWKEKNPGKVDGILTELLLGCVLVLGAAGLACILHNSYQGRGIFYFGVSITTGQDMIAVENGALCVGVVSFLLIFFLTAFFGGCCVLLIRKKLLGIWKETSFVWKLLRRWQEAEPLEKRIQKEEQLELFLAWLCAAASAGASIWVMAGWNVSEPLLITLAAPVFMAILMMKLTGKGLARDTAALLGQIHEMAEGNLDAEAPDMEDPDVRQGSRELGEIRENMKRIINRQIRAERMRVDLITNVSHDLKTPLTSMIGYLDLLKKTELSPEARDYVEVLSSRHEQLKDMIQDIFELSKSTSGTAEFHMEELDMKKLLEQTLGDMEDAIVRSGMDIREKLPESSLPFMGDGKKMYRVLQNLISNALKYSMKGTRIYIEAFQRNGNISLTIKNTASYEMDFSAEEILERFVRADKARNTEEGHGLGLAIADSFVKNMGGRLNASVDGDQFKVTVEFGKITE